MGDGSAEKGGERCEGVICGHIYCTGVRTTMSVHLLRLKMKTL
jgi:hypothetical protein